MFRRTFIVCACLTALITSGCITYQHKTVYKDSDVKVIFHQPLSFALDPTSPSHMEITVAGHIYKLADCIDGAEGGCKGFLKTSDASAIVFAVQDGKEWRPLMSSTLHIVNLKTKSDTAVPLQIHWSSFNPKMTVKSYDGHQLVLFVDSQSDSERDGILEIDLDAKRVMKFERVIHSVPAK